MYSKLRLSKWNVRLVILVMLVIFLLVPSITFAYELLGREWDSVFPLYYYVDSGTDWGNRFAYYYAVADWNAADTPVCFVYSFYYYDVLCMDDYVPGVTWDGFYYLYPWSGPIERADLILNTKYTDVYPSGWKKSIAGHELGHALGLGEMERTDRVLMNWHSVFRYAIYQINTPQQDDINGVNAIYD